MAEMYSLLCINCEIWLNNLLRILTSVIISKFNFKYFFPIMSFNGFDAMCTSLIEAILGRCGTFLCKSLCTSGINISLTV